MYITQTENIYAHLALGLERGYTKGKIRVNDVYKILAKLQCRLQDEQGLFLSANCFKSKVVMNKQREPHLNIHFLNYPLYDCTANQFKEAVTFIVKELMEAFDQNRVVISFPYELVMMEKTKAVNIDTLSKKNKKRVQ